MSTVAAAIACVVLLGLAVLQVLVACGLPYGRFVWGGQHTVVPTRLRVGSAVAVVLYAAIAALLLSRAGILPGGTSVVIVVLTWIVCAYFVVGIALNLISRSLPERWTMAPVSAVLAVCALILALGGPGTAGAEPETVPGTPTASAAPTAEPSPDETASEPPAPTGPVDIVTGLRAPWSMVVVDTSVLISERDSARILELTGTGDLREVATVDGVVPGGEGGLLGLARDGDDGLYAAFTAADDNRVVRFTLIGTPGDLGVADPAVVIDGLPKAGIHNGGRIAFGPDRALYIAAGDAGDPAGAQNPESLSGKILRVNPDGSIPADNPTAGSPVYSLGHRNVQGLAWTDDGTMLASEFGQNAWDELNVIVAGGNYGWPVVEGTGGEGQGFRDPVQVWETSAASPSGIAVIGDALYIANLRGRVLREVPLADLGSSREHLAGEYGRLRDVIAGPDGTVWVLTNNTDGRGDAADGDDRIVSVPVG
ncbi:PQQ-dependent sugar dehydrogenase [Microbacterium sp. MC2]